MLSLTLTTPQNQSQRTYLSLSMPSPAHLRLPVHIRLRLPVQRLGITRGLECVLRRLLGHIHLRQPIRGSRFGQQLDLAAPLHQRVQIASLVDRPANCQQSVVAQDQAFAFGPKSGGQTLAFFFGEDDTVEFLRSILLVLHTTKPSQENPV